MGGGSWTRDIFVTYSTSIGRSVSLDGSVDFSDYSTQDVFKSKRIDKDLNPYNVMRECINTEEHPDTKPVIIGLDVTGSMGDAAMECASKLNTIMTNIYEAGNIKDIEFCIMGIGDLAYDDAPIQMSQLESDIRIAEHLDKVYFEGGGGGNAFESYTAAWYMASRHTKFDRTKNGKKSLIITLGDEPLNPYLPKEPLSKVTGDNLQADVETSDLYKETAENFGIYHIYIDHRTTRYSEIAPESFKKILGKQNVFSCKVDELDKYITDIATSFYAEPEVIGIDLAAGPDHTTFASSLSDNVITW